MVDLMIYIVRSLIVILATWLITNFIGKKSIAQLTPYDLAILFIISNVGAQPLVNKDSFKTAFGMILLGLSIVLIARLSLNKFFYQMDTSPSIVIANGQINEKELKKNRMSVYMLLSLLRVQGYFKISDINYAILETSGDVSVIPRAQSRPVTPKDMQLYPQEDGLTYAVIIDGQMMKQALHHAKVSEDWLVQELKKLYMASPHEVFYAEVDSDKQLFANLYASSKSKKAN
ncbi:DUF421 domain-containing protein [Fictibacillus fluitans]|uniref:DUF421 domain-containing protein n=1 Tax=Fictibacillus fluitans TaxID=3058422 RepID=A0ABT8I123_9BACL|nr:DUF421 domain-containing protein [Fictibacillus sp. NE201]MDN4526688.1 DUF421 domain-containing protein [Fictibacillus sp. NE201]